MSEHIPGTFDQKEVNGRKVVIITIVGLFLFTVFATLGTYFGGRWWGNALNKKALANEHNVEMERMKLHDKSRQ